HDEKVWVKDGATVVRQVVLTATITAPPDLWLLRHVLGFFAELGLLQKLVSGDAIVPGACEVEVQGRRTLLHAAELDKDLTFLLSRGMVEQYDDGYRIAGHPRVRDIFTTVRPRPANLPASTTSAWRHPFADQ